MKRKLQTAIFMMTLVLPIFMGAFGLAQPAKAQELPENVSITVNKKQQDKDSSASFDNENAEDLAQLDSLLPVEGAGFTVYNVTEKFYTNWEKAENKDKTAKEMVTAFTQSYTVDVADHVKDEQKTGEKGKTTFENLPLKTTWTDNNKNRTEFSVYFVKESTTPTGVIKGEDLVVALPIYDKVADKNVIRTDINVYPKNKFDSGDVELEKRGSDNKLLSEVEFTLQNAAKEYYTGAKTANGIAEFKKVNAGETIPTVKTIDGKLTFEALADGTYTLSETKTVAGYKITFTSKEFTVENGKVKGLLKILTQWETETGKPSDFETTNKVEFKTGDDQGDLLVENKAIGYFSFIKVDSNNQEKGLAGAEFVVTKGKEGNDANEELYYNEQTGSYKWTSEVTDQDGFVKVVITTDDQGRGKLQGLHLGTYYLKEIKAPKNYVLPNDPYTEIKAELDNKKPTEITYDKKVENMRKGGLPSTGGNGFYLFLLIGTLVTGTALIAYQKVKKSVEV